MDKALFNKSINMSKQTYSLSNFISSSSIVVIVKIVEDVSFCKVDSGFCMSIWGSTVEKIGPLFNTHMIEKTLVGSISWASCVISVSNPIQSRVVVDFGSLLSTSEIIFLI